jgi:catechol 2,3-dioxygenase-like lactoylglutathione lyase family enzyme
MNVQQAVPFFRVKDIDVSLRCYVEGLGFEMKNKWIHEGKLRWCRLQLGGAAIMLQEFWRDGRHAGAPEGKLGQGLSICFQCSDALEIYRTITSRGIKAQTPVVGNHMWVTSLVDPDGYRLEFESPTDVSEETVFAE